MMIFDETHLIKNSQTEANLTVKWLEVNFYLFLTVISMPAGVFDFMSYMNILERPNLNLYKEENLQTWSISEWKNLYRLDDDHSTAVLRLIRKAVKIFIFRITVTSAMQSQYIRTIWKECLIRRTYSSQISFNSGRIIGSAMPRIHATVFNCRFLSHELKHY